ncbi:hypothetical protein LGZ99_22285 [Photorhabdus temperata]|uniref:Uncharacterized protein n=2 Tax=Photorhabdus temperata TaxID=574560 RepID=A0A081RRF5_PHOTE|nr:hypothetical protein [Photorhabdus temperata]EQC00213.1 hypothetical protein B738_12374 [Photorhabdus temperata subsp. temperata M1021]ERT10481.1 hypothetical protein O185_24595 [Photorhabdus temperata J3]KER01258.1 hypothetical protein MEG1DRAFT_04153 [Photorhabdus temperata subsp. temperata Meg1]MCT8349853.1 hypothetical protein [Photorhabdus temperata]
MKLEQHERPSSIEDLSNSNSVPITVWEPNLSLESRWIDATTQRAGALFKDSAYGTSAWDIVSVGGRKAFKAQALSKSSSYGSQCFGIATDTPVDAKHCYCELDLFCNPYPEITVCVLSKKTSVSGTYRNIGYGYMAIHLTGGYKGKTQWMPSNIPLGTSIDTATPYVMVWNLQANLIQSVNFVGKQIDGIYNGQPTLGRTPSGVALSYEWPKNTWSRWRIGLLAENNGTLIIEWYNTVADKWKVELCQYNMNTLMTGNLASGQIGIMYGMSSDATTVDQQNSLYRTPFDRAIFLQDF